MRTSVEPPAASGIGKARPRSTKGSETYSPATIKLLARSTGIACDDGESAYVTSVVHGKHLNREAVTNQFIHPSFNFAEATVLRHLVDALMEIPA